MALLTCSDCAIVWNPKTKGIMEGEPLKCPECGQTYGRASKSKEQGTPLGPFDDPEVYTDEQQEQWEKSEANWQKHLRNERFKRDK
jgi:predicted RNA-binding Zn-ribbon protein involved in translation (DUF1610 family)